MFRKYKLTCVLTIVDGAPPLGFILQTQCEINLLISPELALEDDTILLDITSYDVI